MGAGLAVALAMGCAGDRSRSTADDHPDLTSSTAPEARSGFPPQPAGVPWPTKEWAEAPWPQGADRLAVDEATDLAFVDGAVERVRAGRDRARRGRSCTSATARTRRRSEA